MRVGISFLTVYCHRRGVEPDAARAVVDIDMAGGEWRLWLNESCTVGVLAGCREPLEVRDTVWPDSLSFRSNTVQAETSGEGALEMRWNLRASAPLGAPRPGITSELSLTPSADGLGVRYEHDRMPSHRVLHRRNDQIMDQYNFAEMSLLYLHPALRNQRYAADWRLP